MRHRRGPPVTKAAPPVNDSPASPNVGCALAGNHRTLQRSGEDTGPETREVGETAGLQETPRIACAPAFIGGPTSLCGQVLPVVDLRLRSRTELKAPPSRPWSSWAQSVVDECASMAGAFLDQAREVLRIEAAAMEPPLRSRRALAKRQPRPGRGPDRPPSSLPPRMGAGPVPVRRNHTGRSSPGNLPRS